jgi:MarR family transcriptional regulator, transcriptional regulator for hemolysin
MGPPEEPIGLSVTRTAKALSRAFDVALADGGGSLPSWLVLASLKSGLHATQREIAEDVGVEGPTLTHHLNRMEAAGLVTRVRDPRNQRAHRVELTPEGELAFQNLLARVQAFDLRLRAGFSEEELTALRRLLARLVANVAPGGPAAVIRDGPKAYRREEGPAAGRGRVGESS